ncbi:hypothetical protein [Halorubrum sp. SY-15]|jgi:hypothetical protein|uniref:hypothetical protein n=1 Tax=Halorubrum sp. SY-15 TaxID=3402277 RepID=UPI003EC0D009
MTDERAATDTEATDQAATDPDAGDDEDDTGHLDDLPDGAGCTEIWEHISDNRDE